MDVEEIIRRAKREGKFDELPGKGKPLNLAERGAQDVVQSLMKEAGFTPAWAQVGKDLDASAEAARRLAAGWDRQRALLLQEAASRLAHGRMDEAQQVLRRMAAERDEVARDLALRCTRERRETERYNLLVPGAWQRRPLPSPERLLLAFLEGSPDVSISAEAPTQFTSAPASLDIAGVLDEARQAAIADEGDRRQIGMQRAEALMAFKQKFRRPTP